MALLRARAPLPQLSCYPRAVPELGVRQYNRLAEARSEDEREGGA
jgi:hypothetical protein